MEEVVLSKEKTVSELFGLRAGLSQISTCTNKIVAEENAISYRRSVEAAREKAHKENVQAILDEEALAKKPIEEYIEKIRQDQCPLGELGTITEESGLAPYKTSTVEEVRASILSIERAEKPSGETKFLHYLEIVFGILGIPGLAAYIYMLCRFDPPAGLYVGFGWLVVISLGSFIGMVSSDAKKPDSEKYGSAYLKNLRKYKKYVEQCKVRDFRLARLNAWCEPAKAVKISKCEKMIEEEKRKSAEKLQSEKARFNEEMATLSANNGKEDEKSREKIRMLAAQSESVDHAMTVQYPWISKSDWGNTDMVIYYLQTGRADTLKEALYQVVRQLQSDRLAQTMKESAAYVGRTINETLNRNFRELNKTIQTGMDSVGMKLSAIGYTLREVSYSLDELSETVEESSRSYARIASVQGELLDATRLNAALLEKSNCTSQELLSDLRYQQRYWVK